MRCVVFGATGYLGTRLVPQLVSAGHDVRVMARTPAKLDDVPWREHVEVVEGDVTGADQVRQALEGQEVLYYLVHSMLKSDFVDTDARAALTVAHAATEAELSRIVYMGGIIAKDQELSDHLASRAEVGRLLMESGVPTVELRAAVIIGAGSASFEMLRYLTERLPVMITPRWLRTTVQPIAVRDVLYYLVHAANLPPEVNRPFDIGGPDTFTYTEMSRKYAAVAELRRRFAIPVPVLTPKLSSHWVNLVTPIPRELAGSLMASLENDVVCTEHDIADYIPDPEGGLTPYEESVELALAGAREDGLRTRWSRPDADEAPSRPLPTDPAWSGGSLYQDVRERRVRTEPETLWRAVESTVADSISAEDGRSAASLGWALRGWTGKLPGRTRHSARQSQRLNSVAALNGWSVEQIEPPHLLRLCANARLPGRLWLELSVHPDQAPDAVFRQRVLFQPYGLGGEAFWRASVPFRYAVFGGIARSILRSAAELNKPAPGNLSAVRGTGQTVHSDV
ncbi:MAG: DUF2867 domain-containing protein [Mycobacterium sp.]|uniref:DUF2867 domain-containing protein n=1 Tax=Mycobacterium sp. TaxID=1785 RepID=UPI003CC6B577